MAIGDVYQVKLYSYETSNDQAAINTVYFKETATVGTGTTALQLAAQLESVMAPLYKGWMSSVAQWWGITAQRVQVASPLIPSESFALRGAGTGTANMVATQVCGLVKIRTSFAGRHYHGRIYMGFADLHYLAASGELTGAGTATLTNIGTGLMGPVTSGAGGNTSTLGLAIRSDLRVHPTDPHIYTYTPAIAAIGGIQWATQRRRGDYGRQNAPPLP